MTGPGPFAAAAWGGRPEREPARAPLPATAADSPVLSSAGSPSFFPPSGPLPWPPDGAWRAEAGRALADGRAAEAFRRERLQGAGGAARRPDSLRGQRGATGLLRVGSAVPESRAAALASQPCLRSAAPSPDSPCNLWAAPPSPPNPPAAAELPSPSRAGGLPPQPRNGRRIPSLGAVAAPPLPPPVSLSPTLQASTSPLSASLPTTSVGERPSTASPRFGASRAPEVFSPLLPPQASAVVASPPPRQMSPPALEAWTDDALLAAAAEAARDEHCGAQRARAGAGVPAEGPGEGTPGDGRRVVSFQGFRDAEVAPAPARKDHEPSGVPFLLVRKHLVRLLEQSGSSLQSERGLQAYRQLLQQVADATVGESGRHIFFPSLARPLRPAGSPCSSAPGDRGVAACQPAASTLLPAPSRASWPSAAAALETPTSHLEVSFLSASAAGLPCAAAQLSQPRACLSASAQQSLVGARMPRPLSSSPVPSSPPQLEPFVTQRKAREERRLLRRALQGWKAYADRVDRLASLFWAFQARRRLRRLRAYLTLWRCRAATLRSEREEEEKSAAAEAQRSAALSLRALQAWRDGIVRQRKEEEDDAESQARRQALHSAFEAWRDALKLRRDARERAMLVHFLRAWRRSHQLRKERSEALEDAREAAQQTATSRRVREIWDRWRHAAGERRSAAEGSEAKVRQLVLRRAFEALRTQARAQREHRAEAAASTEDAMRERLLARAFRGWRKATLLQRPPFATPYALLSSQVVCLLRLVALLKARDAEAASEAPAELWVAGGEDAPRSVGEALVELGAARRRWELARAAGRSGEPSESEATAGSSRQRLETDFSIVDAALLSLVPLHGVDMHLPKLSAAAPLMARSLRQYYLRHCFLQWRSVVQRREALRRRVVGARLAGAFHAWRGFARRAKEESEIQEKLSLSRERRLVREAWQAWRKRWARYVLFRSQCRSLQEMRLRHLKALVLRGWWAFAQHRRAEETRISAASEIRAAALRRRNWGAWKEAWQTKRRLRAMEEAADLLRGKALLAKAMRGLKRQRNSARILSSAARALERERQGVALALWWRWAARRAAFQELCDLQQAKTREQRFRAVFRSWRNLALRRRVQQKALARVAALVDEARARRIFREWCAGCLRMRQKEVAANRLQAVVGTALLRTGWRAWIHTQGLAAREEDVKRRRKRRMQLEVLRGWAEACKEQATVQLHLRGQLLCSKLSRLLHQWQRLAFLSRLGFVQRSRSRVLLLRRTQHAWLSVLQAKRLEHEKEARALHLCRTFRLRAARHCLLAWRETAADSVARRGTGETLRLRLQRRSLAEVWEAWKQVAVRRRTQTRAFLQVARIRERRLLYLVLDTWKETLVFQRQEETAVQWRQKSLLQAGLGAWLAWSARRREKREDFEALLRILDRDEGARRRAEKTRGKEILAAWLSETQRRLGLRVALSTLECLANRLSLRLAFASWRLRARREAAVSQASAQLASWRRRCLLRVSWAILRGHQERLKQMELSSYSHLSILRHQQLLSLFAAWRARAHALRKQAADEARRRQQSVQAVSHALVACKRKAFLSWLSALAAKLQLKQKTLLLLKRRRDQLERRVLRGWCRVVRQKAELRESLAVFSESHRLKSLRRTFSALFVVVSRQRMIRARLLFSLGLLAPSADFAVASGSSSSLHQPLARSPLLSLSPLAEGEEASLQRLWGRALPAPGLREEVSPSASPASAGGGGARQAQEANLFASLPLVPRLIVWAAQPHMLHLLLLQPGIAASLVHQAPNRGAGEGLTPCAPLLPSREGVRGGGGRGLAHARLSRGVSEARRKRLQTRLGGRSRSSSPLWWGEPGDADGRAAWEEDAARGGELFLDLAASGSGLGERARRGSSRGTVTPSTCTPHTALTVSSVSPAVPLGFFGGLSELRAPAAPQGSEETPSSLPTESSRLRARSASVHIEAQADLASLSRRRSISCAPPALAGAGDGDEDLLLADKRSSKCFERLLRCYARAGRRLRQGGAGARSEATAAVSTAYARPQSDLQALLLAQVSHAFAAKSAASPFLPPFAADALTPTEARLSLASSEDLDTSRESERSEQSSLALSAALSGRGADQLPPAQAKNWREEIPLDLLASAWASARLLHAFLRAWSLRARSRKTRRRCEAAAVSAFGAHRSVRLVRFTWRLWWAVKAGREESARRKKEVIAWGLQSRVFAAWRACAAVDSGAVARAEAFCAARLNRLARERVAAWREIAGARRAERQKVEAWRASKDGELKAELFRLWTHLAAVNRAGAQLYVQRKRATTVEIFTSWMRETAKRQTAKKLATVVARPGLFAGFSLLRIWSLTRSNGLRRAAACLDAWRQYTERRRRLAGAMVYFQTLGKVSLLQHHFSAWLDVQRRRRRLLVLQRTAEIASLLLPLHRVFARWRALAVDRLATRSQLLHQFLAHRQTPFLALSAQASGPGGESADARGRDSCYAYWARWRVEEAWAVWKRRFRLRTLLRRQATRCARACLDTLKQAVQRRRAVEAFVRRRRALLVQRALVAWQVYVQRRLLKEQRTAHAVERYQGHVLQQSFGQWRWLLQRLQWERAVVEVSQAKANRRICSKVLEGLRAHAASRLEERRRVATLQRGVSARLLFQLLRAWRALGAARQHAAQALVKSCFARWRTAFKTQQGLDGLAAAQRSVERRQLARALEALRGESLRFAAMQTLGEQMPWLRDALEEKIGAARASLSFALVSLRTFAAHRVSRRRQARLLATALGSWTQRQETEGPKRLLRPCLLHWRGALQYRLHLEAAEDALKRHVAFRRMRQAWLKWWRLQREEERERELLKLADETRKAWALERGLLLLHEHRLQSEWMAWCTYRAEEFVMEGRKTQALVCFRAWHAWMATCRDRRRRGLRLQELSRLWSLSAAFGAVRDVHEKRSRLRQAGEFLVGKTERNELRTAWRAWREVYVHLVALKPRLEALLARQAFQRVCLAWSGWRTWQQRRAQLRERLAPLAENAHALAEFRLILGCFRRWREALEQKRNLWRQKESLLQRHVVRRLLKESFGAWAICTREIQFVRSTKAAAATAASQALSAAPRPCDRVRFSPSNYGLAPIPEESERTKFSSRLSLSSSDASNQSARVRLRAADADSISPEASECGGSGDENGVGARGERAGSRRRWRSASSPRPSSDSEAAPRKAKLRISWSSHSDSDRGAPAREEDAEEAGSRRGEESSHVLVGGRARRARNEASVRDRRREGEGEARLRSKSGNFIAYRGSPETAPFAQAREEEENEGRRVHRGSDRLERSRGDAQEREGAVLARGALVSGRHRSPDAVSFSLASSSSSLASSASSASPLSPSSQRQSAGGRQLRRSQSGVSGAASAGERLAVASPPSFSTSARLIRPEPPPGKQLLLRDLLTDSSVSSASSSAASSLASRPELDEVASSVQRRKAVADPDSAAAAASSLSAVATSLLEAFASSPALPQSSFAGVARALLQRALTDGHAMARASARSPLSLSSSAETGSARSSSVVSSGTASRSPSAASSRRWSVGGEAEADAKKGRRPLHGRKRSETEDEGTETTEEEEEENEGDSGEEEMGGRRPGVDIEQLHARGLPRPVIAAIPQAPASAFAIPSSLPGSLLTASRGNAASARSPLRSERHQELETEVEEEENEADSDGVRERREEGRVAAGWSGRANVQPRAARQNKGDARGAEPEEEEKEEAEDEEAEGEQDRTGVPPGSRSPLASDSDGVPTRDHRAGAAEARLRKNEATHPFFFSLLSPSPSLVEEAAQASSSPSSASVSSSIQRTEQLAPVWAGVQTPGSRATGRAETLQRCAGGLREESEDSRGRGSPRRARGETDGEADSSARVEDAEAEEDRGRGGGGRQAAVALVGGLGGHPALPVSSALSSTLQLYELAPLPPEGGTPLDASAREVLHRAVLGSGDEEDDEEEEGRLDVGERNQREASKTESREEGGRRAPSPQHRGVASLHGLPGLAASLVAFSQSEGNAYNSASPRGSPHSRPETTRAPSSPGRARGVASPAAAGPGEIRAEAEDTGDSEAELRELLTRLERLEALQRLQLLEDEGEEARPLLTGVASGLSSSLHAASSAEASSPAAVEAPLSARVSSGQLASPLAASRGREGSPLSPSAGQVSPGSGANHKSRPPGRIRASVSLSASSVGDYGGARTRRRDAEEGSEAGREGDDADAREGEEEENGDSRDADRRRGGPAGERQALLRRAAEPEEDEEEEEEMDGERGVFQEEEKVVERRQRVVEEEEEEEWLAQVVASSRRRLAGDSRLMGRANQSRCDAGRGCERENEGEPHRDRHDIASIAGSEELLEEAWKEAGEETRNVLLEIHREMKGVSLLNGELSNGP
ncbi:hypothetical protein BESB_007760 [Besnoitia besnoiti]|uniref:Sfi1 spindle body domain-containing protein n=1 Tax=Besnoitia besnoiti TaxID=94643 RepID=A0A2A9MM89_BESBE|nr:hypothetical protein BESB_007760 [Besnoitia besnoiti]PFH38434.1 hypothetical protein BESB_007760 [Besnoitia besnoiti]